MYAKFKTYFNGWVPKRGSTLDFIWSPGYSLATIVDGKACDPLVSSNLCAGMYKAWLGADSIVPSVRDQTLEALAK